MGILQMKDTAVRVGGTAVDKTKYAARLVSCTVQLTAEKTRLHRLYQQLGRLSYRDHLKNAAPDEADYQPIYDRLDECCRSILRLRRELAELRQKETESEEVLTVPQSPEPEEVTLDEEQIPEEEPEAE